VRTGSTKSGACCQYLAARRIDTLNASAGPVAVNGSRQGCRLVASKPLADRPVEISSPALERRYRKIAGAARSFALPLTTIEQLPQVLHQKTLFELSRAL
jgi:hypothetical protein